MELDAKEPGGFVQHFANRELYSAREAQAALVTISMMPDEPQRHPAVLGVLDQAYTLLDTGEVTYLN